MTSNRLSGSITLQANITSQFNVRSQTNAATDVTATYRRNYQTHKGIMMTGKSSLPEDRKVVSRGYSELKGKREKWRGGFFGLSFRILTFGLEKSYWTLRLRDTTNFYFSAKGRKLTNSSHRDLLILRILSCAHNTGTFNPDYICNSRLINEHNSGCRHHLFSWTTLKKRA